MSFPVLAAGTPVTEAAGSDTFLIGAAVALMVVAIGLFFLELLIPSFGLITLVGIACVVGALFAAFSASRPAGLIFVAIVVVLIPILVYLAVKIVKRTSLVLKPEDTPSTGTGPTSGRESGLAPGARGVALTVLRPSGTANFDGRKVSVVTEGDMVEAGVQIEIVRVEGIRTVVRPVRV